MFIKNKIDPITNKQKEINILTKDFKKIWEDQGLSLEYAIFKTYFEAKINHKNANNLINKIKLDVLEQENEVLMI